MIRFVGRLALLSAFVIAAPTAVAGQSIASGSLPGRVVDEAGLAIFDADVTLLRPGGGDLLSAVTGRAGTFGFDFLTPGDYGLRIEAVGYRPLYVMSVPVRPGESVPVVATLREEAPPVVGVDSLSLPGSASERIRPGESRWLSRLELNHLPDADRSLENALELTALSGPGFGLEGLPASMIGYYVDGLRVAPLRLPGMQRDPLFGALVPRFGSNGVEVILGSGENEWNTAGGAASVVTRSAGTERRIEAFADFTGGSLWSASTLSGSVPDHTTLRGGAVVDVPLIADSVLATFGVEVMRVEQPRSELFSAAALPAWVDQIGGLNGALTAPTVSSRDQVAGFGRIDWKLASDAQVSVRANVLSIAEADPLTRGYPLIPGDIPLASGRDFSAGATLQLPWSRETGFEVKVGLTSSQRTYGAHGDFPLSRIPELPVALGPAQSLPAELSATVFEVAPTGTFEVGDHNLKVGLGATVGSYDMEQASGAGGEFILGGAQGTGLHNRTSGTTLRSDVSTSSFSVFAQDSWNASPGLHLLFGVRVDVDKLPEDDIRVSALYDSLYIGSSASARADTLSDVQSYGSRFSFVWDVGEENRTFVRGGAGISFDPIDPEILHEWVLGDGRRTVSTNVDSGTWPNQPTGGFERPWLTVGGEQVTGVEIKRAKTARGYFGLTRSLGNGVALHAGVSYRRTDDLMRRLDMNLSPESSGMDQFGRPIYGDLLKRGSSLSQVPSLNRRFPGLAQVDFLVFDGFSEYRDFTLGFEHRSVGPMQLFANYTFSRTEDNMVGWANVDVNERRAPILDPEDRNAWVEGTSDFDVPHRLVAGVTYDVPAMVGLRVSALYRLSSGAPFTAGFRPGVDANGDGAYSNDPAYIGSVDLSAIDSQWDCVRSLSNGPVERNSCRGGNVQSVDLRLAYALSRDGGRSLEVFVDALNLIEPDWGVRDAALYLVDPLAPVTRTGATFDVPLTANPNFGNLTVLQTPGRTLRLGLRIAR